MVWTTVTNSASFGSRRQKKKINLDAIGGQSSWSGQVDNINMIQQVYRGRYDRLERYRTYDWMDRDSDVARALDLIAEHCSEKNIDGDFWNINWVTEEPTEEISAILRAHMAQWTKVNEFNKRMFQNIRNIIKYGDWFYFRNPHTLELNDIHPKLVLGALVDRQTNEVLAWIIRNFKFNVENLELAIDSKSIQDTMKNLGQNGVRATKVIPAMHIVHLTLSQGRLAGTTSDDDPMDRYSNRWPFGESMLEQIYKTFKQRELLEDANIIHRVQRAPSRNVWYIDTGKMRPDRANWTVQNFKNELNQTRIPQFIGQDQKTVDSTYNAISQLEDIYIPVSMDQRGSKVETLEGQPWESTPDLDYFKKKMFSALRVPYAWMLGPSDGGSMFNDGRAGVAYQEEIEFSRMCTRFHNLFIDQYDIEFKLYCTLRDVEVNPSDFNLEFVPPDNYEESKRLARQQEAIGVWAQIKDESYISKRFALKHFLGLTDDQILENERMLTEETNPAEAMSGGGMGAAGGIGGMPLGGPMGGPMAGTGINGPMGMDQAGLGGATGADMAGGGMADLGGGAGGGMGGMGESEINSGITLLEDLSVKEAIDVSKIKPVDRKYDDTDLARTPDDKVVGNQDKISNRPIATLELLGKMRRTQMARRIEQNKRLKLIAKIYKPAPDLMGGGGGLI